MGWMFGGFLFVLLAVKLLLMKDKVAENCDVESGNAVVGWKQSIIHQRSNRK